MRLLLVLVLVSFLASCDDLRVYEKNTEIDNKIWRADSILSFAFEVTDIKENYNLLINIRNSVSYPFENIYITYYLKDTANNELVSELVNYNLFDPKTGRPYGEGLGDIFDHQFLLLENYKFEKPGPYIFQIQQYMRMDSLPDIIAAGVRLEKNIAVKQEE